MASRTVRMSQLSVGGSVRRSQSMETYMVRVYPGPLSQTAEFLSVEALKNTQAEEIVRVAVNKLGLGNAEQYELAETFSSGGQLCKERRLASSENPVRVQLMWPRTSQSQELHRTEYLFYLRRKEPSRQVGSWLDAGAASPVESFLSAFLQQPSHKEYPDLCNLPNLNETTLLQNLRSRFHAAHIYTYVGSILISVNPFKFYPIYNPKYVRMYQRRRLQDLPPHIFAIADAAFHAMLEQRRNQCIVISGESGSGKTESTNLLLHHLSALSQRDPHGTGVEQTILGAGPVLEAFGNAKTVHNNNSSRFGKFIQVNYRENGLVHGAVVEKYLLEKSRIVQQIENERNYHVFYYLLAGATDQERESLVLLKPPDYGYLNKTNCYTLEGADGECTDEAHEFARLRQSMETVGFSTETQRRIFCVLSAVLHLGNIEYRRKADHQHHEAVSIKNNTTVKIISNLLKVKEATLVEALTKKKTTAGGETVVFSYNMPHALATRDAVAKCLYGGLFDWIVLQVNHALLAKKDYREHHGNSIGVLDIFGFEDFGNNSFEQFCINYANERLHYYFNQHIFKFEQEEYIHEGISWKNIEFIDNTGCLDLFSRRLTGLLALIDEECNFPGATDDTLLSKLHAQHKDNPYYEVPQMKESAFTIVHYAGNVKYQIQAFREKNADLMRHDIVLVLKNSGLAFVRELVGYDPVAVLRWAIVRAFFRAYFAFLDAGKRHRKNSASEKSNNIIPESPKKTPVSSVEQRPPRRRVIIVEKYGNKHASYHGDMSTDILGSPPPDFDPESGLLNNQEDHRVVLHATEAWNTPPRDQTIRKANRALQKSKSFRPRSKSVKTFRDLQTMKTLACRAFNPRSSKGKNKPPSVSQQFNHSLSKLMETLNQANPFFIRCIKSNAEKAPIKFDEEIVLRQLRYTGMLATVRIRQSGYNYRLPFDEFIQQYKILLPHGLHSSREDIMAFLDTLELPRDSYQLGKTKIFLREAQKLLLDDSLHRAIIRRIVNIQRWVKTKLERKRFLRLRSAVVVIQASWRGYLGRRRVEQLQLRLLAAILIQRVFRGFRQRRSMRERHMAAVCIQSHIRGYLARRHVKRLQDGSHDLQRKHEAATCIQKYIRRMCAMHKVDAMRHQRMIERDERQAQGDSAKPHVAPSPIPSRDTLPAPAGRAANYYVGDDVPSPGSEKDIVAPLPFPTKKETAPPSEDTLASATLDLPTKSQDRLSYRVETFVPSATIYTLPAHTDIRTVATASVTTSPERIMAEDSRTSPTLRTPNRLRTPISPKRSRPVPNSRSHLYEVKSSDKPDSPTVPEQKIPVMTSMDIPNTVLTSERKKLYRSSEIDLPSDKLKSVPSAPEFTDLRRIPPTGPDEFDANGDSGRRWSGSSADDKVKEWERKYMMKENQKEASQSSVRSQAGPQELEIMIHPAVQKSPLQHHTTLCTDPARVPWSKKVLVAAPLATLESLTDSTDENRPYGRRIVIERRDPPEEPVSVSERRDTLTSTEDTAELEVPNNQESSSALSPFHRAKKHLKNFMGEPTAEDDSLEVDHKLPPEKTETSTPVTASRDALPLDSPTKVSASPSPKRSPMATRESSAAAYAREGRGTSLERKISIITAENRKELVNKPKAVVITPPDGKVVPTKDIPVVSTSPIRMVSIPPSLSSPTKTAPEFDKLIGRANEGTTWKGTQPKLGESTVTVTASDKPSGPPVETFLKSNQRAGQEPVSVGDEEGRDKKAQLGAMERLPVAPPRRLAKKSPVESHSLAEKPARSPQPVKKASPDKQKKSPAESLEKLSPEILKGSHEKSMESVTETAKSPIQKVEVSPEKKKKFPPGKLKIPPPTNDAPSPPRRSSSGSVRTPLDTTPSMLTDSLQSKRRSDGSPIPMPQPSPEPRGSFQATSRQDLRIQKEYWFTHTLPDPLGQEEANWDMRLSQENLAALAARKQDTKTKPTAKRPPADLKLPPLKTLDTGEAGGQVTSPPTPGSRVCPSPLPVRTPQTPEPPVTPQQVLPVARMPKCSPLPGRRERLLKTDSIHTFDEVDSKDRMRPSPKLPSRIPSPKVESKMPATKAPQSPVPSKQSVSKKEDQKAAKTETINTAVKASPRPAHKTPAAKVSPPPAQNKEVPQRSPQPAQKTPPVRVSPQASLKSPFSKEPKQQMVTKLSSESRLTPASAKSSKTPKVGDQKKDKPSPRPSLKLPGSKVSPSTARTEKPQSVQTSPSRASLHASDQKPSSTLRSLSVQEDSVSLPSPGASPITSHRLTVNGKSPLSRTVSQPIAGSPIKSPVVERHSTGALPRDSRHELHHQKELWFSQSTEPMTIAEFEARTSHEYMDQPASPASDFSDVPPSPAPSDTSTCPSAPPPTPTDQASHSAGLPEPPKSPSTLSPPEPFGHVKEPVQRHYTVTNVPRHPSSHRSSSIVWHNKRSSLQPDVSLAVKDMHEFLEKMEPKATSQTQAAPKHVIITHKPDKDSKHSKSMKVDKKGQSGTGFIRYSKMSLRYLLDQRSMRGRKHHKKEGGEESEGSDTEEPTSPASNKGGAPHWPSKPGSQTRKLTKESINLDQDLPAGKRKRRKNSKKHNRDHFKCDMAHNTWSVSSTSQWKYPVDVLVKGRGELRQLDTYMGNKISELKKNEDQHRETTFDVVFKNSVISFQTDMNFVMATLQDHIELRYKELMMKFEETLKAQARQRNVNLDCETDFPTTLAINAFRGYLDEFNKKKKPMKDVPLRETKKEKKTRKEKEREQIMERLGHRFQLNSFNIPTYCELCSSLIWMVDKGLVCQVCKYTIHKKCYLKVNTKCRTGTHRKSKGTGNLIGRALDEITAEGEKVSSVIEKLILAIELNGLYTVGLYRKAGAAGITRKLLNSLDHEKWSDIDYNDYPIHVLTSVIKTIFRELPEPLLTYDLYDDFLRAAEVSDDKARIQLLYSVIERLPTLNHDVLESLVFHLAKVAQHEDSNRMTSSALAIVFAPSLLRSNRNMPAQESLLQVGKQTRCLECVIGEQLRKVETTLKDINSLETATASANDRLSQVRASIRANEQQEPVSPGASAPTSPTVMETDPVQEEKILTQQISTLRKEKEKLTITMPALECRHSSSEEDILSADDIESTADTTDGQDPFYEEFAATFDDLPVSPSKSLRHLNKHRAPTPIRRQPTKRHHAVAATATVAASDKPAGNPSNLASKPGLASPELTQVGEEILV